ncbi:MAG: hypothetical protein KJN97_03110, partial [Deltaproteobacteria bacterium]|nr:hypothetical protein [Deltaproteobacteria bacterium]
MSDRGSHALWTIVFVGLVARVASWWFQGGFHYPDEIFQQVEPAHHLRTGVAWLPWEFTRGLRSWLLPAVYAAQFEILSWAGVTGLSALRLVTLHNALMTLLMVPAGYRIGVALWPNGGSDAKTAGLSVALFTALLPGLLYYAPHTLIGTPCMVSLSWGYVYWLEARQSQTADPNALVRCGFFFGVAGALRATCGVHMLVPLVDLLWRTRLKALRPLVLGAALPVLAIGAVDMITWGSPFHSTIEHLRYNVLEGGASEHGTLPWHFYVTEPLWQRLGPLAFVFWLVVIAGLGRSWLVVLTFAVPSIVTSSIAHKEERFLMYNWPLIAAALGIGWLLIARWLKRHARIVGPVAAVMLAAALLASNLHGTLELPSTLRRGMFRAQSYVGKQPDATGLLLDDRQHMNGGYLVLDKTVPQVEYTRERTANALYNYAALRAGHADA